MNQTSISTSQRDSELTPSRITLARMSRGLTISQLADELGVDRRSVHGYEAGSMRPADANIEKIAYVLDHPIGFFFGDEVDIPTPEAISFRSMARMTANHRAMAQAQFVKGVMVDSWIRARFNTPALDLPEAFPSQTKPEDAAAALRMAWKLGTAPIKNMIHLLESKGVRVFSLSMETTAVDAFSVWQDGAPYIFLNNQKSAERSRFDAAHELGHLLLHSHGSQKGRVAELEADQFASAFLMPSEPIRLDYPKIPSIAAYIRYKKVWNVSLAAMVFRAHSLGVISDWHYRALYREMSRDGFRKHEPDPSARERSLLFDKVLNLVQADGSGVAEIASKLMLPEREVASLLFQTAIARSNFSLIK